MSSLQVVGRERTNLRMKRAFENHHLIFPKQFYQMQAMHSNTWAYVSHSHSKHHIPQTCPGGQSMLCGHFNLAMLKPFFKSHFSYIHNICKLYFFSSSWDFINSLFPILCRSHVPSDVLSNKPLLHEFPCGCVHGNVLYSVDSVNTGSCISHSTYF